MHFTKFSNRKRAYGGITLMSKRNFQKRQPLVITAMGTRVDDTEIDDSIEIDSSLGEKTKLKKRVNKSN